MFLVRGLAIVALCGVVCFTPACSRLVRAASRTPRSSGGGGSQSNPEDVRFRLVPLDAKATAKLNGYRAKWSDLVQKYNATDVQGSAQVLAVLDAVNNAHWSEKPKIEDIARPIGVALGDALRQEGGGVDWVLIEGTAIGLGGANGKVIVAPVDIATRWLTTKTHPYAELVKEVGAAVRDTKGTPAQIGFKEDEDESDADMV